MIIFTIDRNVQNNSSAPAGQFLSRLTSARAQSNAIGTAFLSRLLSGLNSEFLSR